MKLSLKNKLNLVFGLVLLVLIATGLSAYWRLTPIRGIGNLNEEARQDRDFYATNQLVWLNKTRRVKPEEANRLAPEKAAAGITVRQATIIGSLIGITLLMMAIPVRRRR